MHRAPARFPRSTAELRPYEGVLTHYPAPRRRGRLGWYALIILAVLLLIGASNARAQPYFGGSLGYGQTGVGDADRYRSATFHIDQSVRSTTYGAFAGYRFNWFAIEGGGLKLPEYFARMHTSDYTAYLGKDVGITTAYAEDSVKADAVYLRGNVYLMRGAWQPYLAWGVARVFSHQYTDGWYDQGTSNATYGPARYHTTIIAHMAGIGLQYSGERLFGRVEYIQIPRATENPAIGKRDVQMIMLSAGYTF